MSGTIRLDLNDPPFQADVFALEADQVTALITALSKLSKFALLFALMFARLDPH